MKSDQEATINYPQGNAYDVIQEDVHHKFHSWIGKSREDIKNIVVVGAYHGNEIYGFLNSYPNCKVHAIEAVEEHFKVLSSRFQHPMVALYNEAVSDSNHKTVFYELGNGGEGSGSLLRFQGNEKGHHFKVKEEIEVETVRLRDLLGEDVEIDLLQIDVQGAELKVLKGSNLDNVKSMFLEIHTKDFVQPWDQEPYEGQCYREDLESYLEDFRLHSIGLDNDSGNGQGNSFWLRRG